MEEKGYIYKIKKWQFIMYRKCSEATRLQFQAYHIFFMHPKQDFKKDDTCMCGPV